VQSLKTTATWTSLPGGSQLNSKTEEFRIITTNCTQKKKKVADKAIIKPTVMSKLLHQDRMISTIKDRTLHLPGRFYDYNINNMGCGLNINTMVINYIYR
jgi:hypothetical protein